MKLSNNKNDIVYLKLNMKKIFPSLLLLLLIAPLITSAHQPRITESRQTDVIDPEISKAYYAQLTGVPDVYTIRTSTPFDLYVGVLVPDIAGQKKDITATITKDGQLLTVLNGPEFTWTKMFEPFGYDHYWTGPEYKARADAGTYVITVTNIGNDSKYSLAIGEIEHFNFKETVNALQLIPQLKSSFFNESPINFILSPFGWGLILILYVLAGIIGLLYRFSLRRLAKSTNRQASKNIGTVDRLSRLLLSLALLLWAITTTWNPVLIFFSGFTLFEALFSWCGLYAALGKNTCPIE